MRDGRLENFREISVFGLRWKSEVAELRFSSLLAASREIRCKHES